MTFWSPLISVAKLADLLDGVGDPALRVVDTRWVLGQPGAGRAAYLRGHLPGAVHVDVDDDLADLADLGRPEQRGRHPLPDPADFVARLGALGIGDEHRVVAYDDVGGWVAARLWWMLESLRHGSVAVLDGGIGAWTAADLPLTTDVVAWPPARLSLAPAWSGTIDRDALRARLGSVTLLDARAAARYRGEHEPIDAVAGHIPTARNAPTDGNLVEAGGRFLAPDVLASRFAALGADGAERPVVTACGSGVAACHNALAMRAAGLPDPLVYIGSYSDWTQHGYPIVVGSEPGEPPR
ncbi:MAG: sulfurtransferase [Candidatus Limnocylindrales bacterium]